jgi:DNA-binding FadR family transcriptional regulator
VRLSAWSNTTRWRGCGAGRKGALFVSAPDAGPATIALVIYLEYVGTSIEDLLRARLLLEPLAAALAAEHVGEDGIGVLREALRDEHARRSEPAMLSQDRLHVVLGELSGNSMLQLFIDVLTRLTTRYAHTSLRTSKAEVARAKRDSRDAHRAIVEAVIAGEAGQAQIIVGQHLEEVAEWLRSHRRRRPGRAVAADRPTDATGSRAGEKLAEVIAARIHDDIARDGWRVDKVLGSEAGLLARYQVSRAVLREAVRILEYHGVARMRRGPGGGLFIGAPRPDASVEIIALYLDYLGVTGEDLRIVRNTIELGCIPSVLARRNDQQVVDRLRAAVAQTSQLDGAANLFHTELAQVAGNPVLTLFLCIVTELWSRHANMPGPQQMSATPEVERAHSSSSTRSCRVTGGWPATGCAATSRRSPPGGTSSRPGASNPSAPPAHRVRRGESVPAARLDHLGRRIHHDLDIDVAANGVRVRADPVRGGDDLLGLRTIELREPGVQLDR